ncbi:hypothetical protein [Arthrobacter sp.]|uniref:hypothetical protein n=1 Tax=Arthrobacter sp. TaxID=1667 RepID=UPI003A8F7C05
MEQLITAGDLVGFKGAPFPDPVIQSAAESVRTECEWHIAPVITETVKIRTAGAWFVLLPTMRLVEVLGIAAGGQPVTGWEWYQNGVIERRGGFPHVVEIEFRHGYETCPPELLAVIAERASSGSAGRVRQESLGSRSVSLEAGYDTVGSVVLAKYTLSGEA